MRNERARRGPGAALPVRGGLVAALALLWVAPAHAQDKGFFESSPGDLSRSHAELDGQDNCTECHTQGKELSRNKCLGCHDHDDLRKRIRAGEGFHASSKVKGKSCWTCHTEHEGRGYDIMGWDYIGGRDAFDHERDAGWELEGKHRAIECRECHDETNRQGLRLYLGLETTCGSCHDDDSPHEFDRKSMQQCERCHSQAIWNPPKRNMDFDHDSRRDTDFALEGSHEEVSCGKCHPRSQFNLKQEPPGRCDHCHDDPHDRHLFGEKACTQCHSPKYRRLDRIRFNHDRRTDFPLGGHDKLDCYRCHTERRGTRKPRPACQKCHADDNKHGDRFDQFGTPPKCAVCHPSTNWKPTEFSHDAKTKFSLRGKHAEAACRDCHRGGNPAEFERFFADKVGCKGCHQHEDVHPGEGFTDSDCMSAGCHEQEGSTRINPQEAKKQYHGPNSDFPLVKKHKNVECELCHEDGYGGTPKECGERCHQDSLHEGRLGDECSSCHAPGEWPAVKFDHTDDTEWPLEGLHQEVPQCADCHPERVFADTPQMCASSGCHAEDDAHKGKLGDQCDQCHRETGQNVFDHNEQAAFELDGAHLTTRCVECHSSITFKPQPKECIGCHPEPEVHKGLFGTECEGCHSTATFTDIQPLHDVGDFSLRGSHDRLPCEQCHVDNRPLAGTGNFCINCHRQDDIHANSLSPRCGECHSQWSFAPAEFDHTTVGCNLTGLHRVISCYDCHKTGRFRGLSPTCFSCHRDDAVQEGNATGYPHQALTNCGQCHNPNSWATDQTNTAAFGVGRDSICR